MELLSDERMAGRQRFGFKLTTERDAEWTAGGLNAILEINLVPSHGGKGQLRTFCCIQWESERHSGREEPSGPV